VRCSIWLAVVLIALGSAKGFGKPADSPKATLAGWTQHVGDWDIEQTLKIYSFSGDKQAAFARALAGQALTQGKLQKLVRDRWGEKAEAAVARAISDDTLEDDLAAAEKIDGDHATLTFKDETRLPPLWMVKVGREWKVDVPAYAREVGDDLEAPIQLLGQTTAIVQAGLDGLKTGRFKDK
jgi:hypothetical protein